MRDFISYQAVDFEGYKSNRILIRYSDYECEKIMGCNKIVRKFKKNYPNYAI